MSDRIIKNFTEGFNGNFQCFKTLHPIKAYWRHKVFCFKDIHDFICHLNDISGDNIL